MSATSVTITFETRRHAAPVFAAWIVEGECGFQCATPEQRRELGEVALRYKPKRLAERISGLLDMARANGGDLAEAVRVAVDAAQIELSRPKRRKGATK